MKTVKKKARVRFEEREGREGYKIEINLGDKGYLITACKRGA